MCIADDEQRMLMGFMIPKGVYISGQLLEKHPKNCHFRHFLGPSARRPGGTARSASCCSTTRSDMLSGGPGRSKTECVWVHRNRHSNFHRLYTILRGSEWHPTRTRWRQGVSPRSQRLKPHVNLLSDPQDQQAGPAAGPTCAAAWSGRTRPAGVRTGSRSRPSGRMSLAESPPGGALHATPARRSLRSRGCGPAAGSGPGSLEASLRPRPDRLQNAPRIARSHAERCEPCCSRVGREGAIRPPQHGKRCVLVTHPTKCWRGPRSIRFPCRRPEDAPAQPGLEVGV